MNKWSRILFAPVIKVTEWLGVNYPVTLVKLRYFVRFHKFLDLKNPKDLNEKILYLKLFSDTSLWSDLADKYKVREYVKSCGLENCLVKLYGVWFYVDDFDMSTLPNSFVLKANNGDGKGSNLFVFNKNEEAKDSLVKILKTWLSKKNIGALSAEPQYKNIKPCVIAEEILPIKTNEKSIVDYKMWCFCGKVHFILTCSNRSNRGADVMTYDRDWNAHPEYCVFNNRYRKAQLMEPPQNYEEMICVAEKLAKPFPQVRVDLYNIEGKIYFGELTFTSLGGMMDYYTPDFLKKMGDLVDLNYKG